MFKTFLKKIFFFTIYAFVGVALGTWIFNTSPNSQETFYFLSDIRLYIVSFLLLFLFYSMKWLLLFKADGKKVLPILGLLVLRYIQICFVMLCTVGFYLTIMPS